MNGVQWKLLTGSFFTSVRVFAATEELQSAVVRAVRTPELLQLLSHRKQVSLYALRDPQLPTPLFCKTFRLRGAADALGHLGRPSRALRAAKGNRLLLHFGFRAQEVLAVVEQRRFGLTTSSTLYTEFLEQHVSVRAVLSAESAAPSSGVVEFLSNGASRAALIAALAGEVAQLHARKIFHGDLQTDNIILCNDRGFLFVDNERTQRVPIFAAIYRVRNLRQLTSRYSGLCDGEREAFFEAYFRASHLSSSAAARLRRGVDLTRRRSWYAAILPDRLSIEKTFWARINALLQIGATLPERTCSRSPGNSCD